MERDRQLERDLLDRVHAPNGFATQVLERLDRYEATHGNTGWDRPPEELIGEALEECADIFGWGVGAAAQIDDVLRHRLVVAMALGVAAWRELDELRDLLTAES